MKYLAHLILAGLLLGITSTLSAQPSIEYKIVTGGTTGTYYAFGQNLATFVAPPANIALEALPSRGSVQNVRDMRYREKVKFALVQSDVYQAYINLAAQGDREARELIDPLRVILPLYFEEMHFVVPADSPINYIHEVKDKKIYMGPEGSGSALSVSTLYNLLFGTKPARVDYPAQTDTAQAYKQALNNLLDRDGQVEVVVFVAGQPIPQLNVDSEVGRKHYKLLALQTSNPLTQAVQNVYYPVQINRSSYQWLDQDIPTLGVKTYLITYNYPQEFNRRAIAAFARSLCNNYDKLLGQGHPKWRQVNWNPSNPNLEPLKAGWQYYSMTQPILASCDRSPEHTRPCPEERKLLGLCQ